MATLEDRVAVETVTGRSVAEVCADIEHLKSLHAGQRDTRRKIRDLLDGGPGAITTLLGAGYKGETPPVNNLIYSGLTRLAQKIGTVPDLRVEANRDRQSDREQAEIREDIVRGYDELSQLDMIAAQMGRWVPGYGFASAVIVDAQDWQGNPYPKAELRDPYDAYPSSWGVSQEPDRIAYLRRVDSRKLAQTYPTVAKQLNRYHGGAVVLQADHGSWTGQHNGRQVEVAEYIDVHGTWTIATEMGLLCDFAPNPIYPLIPFKVAKRFSFNKLVGQYDHVIGLMIANAKMNLYVLQHMAKNVGAPLFISGELSRGDQVYFGPDTVNFLEQGASAQYLTPPTDPRMFQEIDRIERQLRVTAGYSVTDDAQSPNSFVTGRGLDNLQAGINNEVTEYQGVNRRFFEGVNSLQLAWDEKAYPNKRKPIYGYHQDEPGAPFYTPAKDIKGRWRVKRKYGLLSGLDDAQKVTQLLLLGQAGWIDDLTAMENIQGIDNIPEVRKRREQQVARNSLRDALLGAAQQGDPRAVMALIELLPEDHVKETLQKYYTPEGDEMSPEEEALAAPEPAQGPQSSTTILNRMMGSGATSTGVQTVGQVV